MERQATESELDSILVDVWSFRSNKDGLMERTNMETITLRESITRGGSGMVQDFRPPTVSALLNMPGAE